MEGVPIAHARGLWTLASCCPPPSPLVCSPAQHTHPCAPVHALASRAPPPCPSSPCSALFERATHLQLPPKKMKFLFKRYLEYERRAGIAATVEHVKRRALEYVESQAGM